MSHFSQAFPFIEVIDRLRDPEPAHRYETAAAVEAALRRWPEQPTPAGPHHRARYATALAAGAAVLTAVIVAGVGYRSGPATPEARRDPAPFALKAGDWILVSEFENQTGESVLDGTIRAAVERDLEYSDHVRAAQRDRIEDALKLLQRPLDSALNTSLALQLSQRDGGIRAVVSGSIDRADDGYRLTFDVFDAANQTPLTRLSDHAPGHSDILPAVRRQTLRLREILGEPAASIERSHETFQRARLPSLNALNLASQGRAIINLRPMSPLSEWMRMEKFARAAVQEDAAFPEGHLLLAWALTHGGRRDEGLAHAERAFLLADSATPQERYAITASFHTLRVRMGQLRQRRERELSMAERQEIEKATAALEALFALQPDHYALRSNLRTAYRSLDVNGTSHG